MHIRESQNAAFANRKMRLCRPQKNAFANRKAHIRESQTYPCEPRNKKMRVSQRDSQAAITQHTLVLLELVYHSISCRYVCVKEHLMLLF
jgi:hypothetical protein